jgi:hypothetical protein
MKTLVKKHPSKSVLIYLGNKKINRTLQTSHIIRVIFSTKLHLFRTLSFFCSNNTCFFFLIKHIANSRQQCHNSKFVIFQERLLRVLKCSNFLRVHRWHNCSLAASFTNCIMTLYLLKVHLQTFLSIPITQKWQILSCDTLVANERYAKMCTYQPSCLKVKITFLTWPFFLLVQPIPESCQTNYLLYFRYSCYMFQLSPTTYRQSIKLWVKKNILQCQFYNILAVQDHNILLIFLNWPILLQAWQCTVNMWWLLYNFTDCVKINEKM